ncbi:MAG: hypothetical protein K2X35_22480 [Bryobacteraceae bacterium]|nr:hypothetical protein [Bryobacteraceae bacterium]
MASSLGNYVTPEQFWRRDTFLAAAAGVVVWGASRLLFEDLPGWALAGLSLIRLGLASLPLRRATLWLALPFPYDLVFFAYYRRPDWLPEAWSRELGNPTAFLIFLSGLLLVSSLYTAFVVRAACGARAEAPARKLGIVIFVLVALGALLSNPIYSVWALKLTAEPAALAGWSAVAAFARRRNTT